MSGSKRHIFTSESVTEGHPDKMADQISDAVLDAVLADDPKGRVACEVLITTGICVVSGEITTTTYVDVPRLARSVINDIGFNNASYGFDCTTCGILNTIQSQSPDIAMGVDTGGAGDQGLMFGYACNETPELMPLPIMLAHKLVRQLSEVRRSGGLDFLRPDGKSQVSIEYVNGKPKRVDAVVVSTQHHDSISTEKLRAAVNGNLAPDVRVIAVELVPAEFHARYAARGKTYRYRIFNAPYLSPFVSRFAHHDARPFDLARMKECARLFLGSHDWTAFSAAQTDVQTRVRRVTRLDVSERWSAKGRGRLIEITASADGFLRYMVRSIVGTLLEVGRGARDAETITQAITTGNRALVGATAPAKGLTLVEVHYD